MKPVVIWFDLRSSLSISEGAILGKALSCFTNLHFSYKDSLRSITMHLLFQHHLKLTPKPHTTRLLRLAPIWVTSVIPGWPSVASIISGARLISFLGATLDLKSSSLQGHDHQVPCVKFITSKILQRQNVLGRSRFTFWKLSMTKIYYTAQAGNRYIWWQVIPRYSNRTTLH